MSNNFDGIKAQKFGVEIECTGFTREAAAKAISRVLLSDFVHEGGGYDKYSIKDSQGRKWNVVYDSRYSMQIGRNWKRRYLRSFRRRQCLLSLKMMK